MDQSDCVTVKGIKRELEDNWVRYSIDGRPIMSGMPGNYYNRLRIEPIYIRPLNAKPIDSLFIDAFVRNDMAKLADRNWKYAKDFCYIDFQSGPKNIKNKDHWRISYDSENESFFIRKTAGAGERDFLERFFEQSPMETNRRKNILEVAFGDIRDVVNACNGFTEYINTMIVPEHSMLGKVLKAGSKEHNAFFNIVKKRLGEGSDLLFSLDWKSNKDCTDVRIPENEDMLDEGIELENCREYPRWLREAIISANGKDSDIEQYVANLIRGIDINRNFPYKRDFGIRESDITAVNKDLPAYVGMTEELFSNYDVDSSVLYALKRFLQKEKSKRDSLLAKAGKSRRAVELEWTLSSGERRKALYDIKIGMRPSIAISIDGMRPSYRYSYNQFNLMNAEHYIDAFVTLYNYLMQDVETV